MSSGGQQRRQRNRGRSQQQSRKQVDRLPAPGQAHRTARGAQSSDGALQMFEAYQGLLPHPDHLARFNELSPGAADKIIDEFVAQGVHRREQEAKVVDGNEKRGGRGQGLGFFLLLSAIASGTLVALIADAKIGGAIVAAALASGAIIYVVGGRPPKTD